MLRRAEAERLFRDAIAINGKDGKTIWSLREANPDVELAGLNFQSVVPARDEDGERVAQFYAEAGITADVQPFFDDVPRRMTEAQLVISRSGASSVADISIIGTVSHRTRSLDCWISQLAPA